MIKKYNYIDTSKNVVDLNGKHVYIWGRCSSALWLYLELSEQGAIIDGFIDSFKCSEETEYAGKGVFSPEELENRKGLIIYVAPLKRTNRIEILERLELFNTPSVLMKGYVYGPGCYDTEQLKEKIENDKAEIEYVKNNLYDQYSIDTFNNLIKYRLSNDVQLIKDIYEFTHPQYFAPGIIKCSDNEIFIDAGGYSGETSREFAKYTKNKYEKIYIFEPDEILYNITKENIKSWKLSNVEMVKKGVYSSDSINQFFKQSSSGSSKISENGKDTVYTTSIDSFLGEKPTTFIKMDIEGAEMEALKGADKTISQCMPKLAISIYHKDDDLWKIPFYLMKKYPDYRFFMRHYTDLTIETVLYCVK